MIPKLEQWLKYNKRHVFYDKTCKMHYDLRVHSDGEYPTELIEVRRPTESKEIQEFRKKIFVNMGEAPIGRVIASLTKLRKSSDFTIQFNIKAIPSSIAEKETLHNYITYDFPKHTSFDNWFWSVAFTNMMLDANAITLTVPLNAFTENKTPSNEYLKPYPTIYNSESILDYQYAEYYFLKSLEKTTYVTNQRTYEGSIYYYVDKESVVQFKQSDGNGNFTVLEYLHGLGRCPIVHLNGIVKTDLPNNTLYKSRISPMVASLKELVREYSDLQAAVVQSSFPTLWFYSSQICKICSGAKSIPSKSGAVPCKACGGKGSFPFNPYEHTTINVKDSELGKNPTPTPPGGIIEKDTAIIKLQDERIEKHIYNSFVSVNMQHLSTVQLNQSGLAKEWDRSEPSNFVYMVAEDCVRVMDSHNELFCDIRYNVVVPNKEDRDKMLPMINVPTKYDIINESLLIDDVKKLKDAGFSQSIIAAAELDYANRRFITNPELKEVVSATYELDPLIGKSEADIIMGVQNGFIEKVDAVIHYNIKKFIEVAVKENSEFFNLQLSDKKDILFNYADEQINNELPSTQVKKALNIEQ